MNTIDDLAPGTSMSKEGDAHPPSSLRAPLGLGRPSTHHSKLLPPSSFPPPQRRAASDSDTSMVSSSHSRPSLDYSPSHLSSSDSFPFPRTPTNDIPLVTPPTPILPVSPTKRRKFMIQRKSPLRDTSSTATLKSNTPSITPDPVPSSKTLRRTGRLQKLKLDLAGPEKRSSTAPQALPPPVSFSPVFMTQSINVAPSENIPSAVSLHSADATLSFHNLSLTHLPTPVQSNHLDDSPENPRETSEGRDADRRLLLQFKPRGRVMTQRKQVPSALNERSPVSPTAGFLLTAGGASQSDPVRPLHSAVVGLAQEKDAVGHASSGSDSPEERANSRTEWLRSLRKNTISRLRSVNGLKELNELKKNVEICERRSSERSEGAVRVRVRANNMVAGPSNRSSQASDATIGRSYPRLGSASSGSGMGVVDPRTTPISTSSSSIHSFRVNSRTSIAFADLPHPEHHPQLPEARPLLGSWSHRSSGSGATNRPVSPSRPRRKSSLLGSMFSRPVSMRMHVEERDHGTEELETMARKTEEMMRATIWGKGVADKRWSGESPRWSQRYQQQRGHQSSVNINPSASASRSSIDMGTSRSTSPVPPIQGFGSIPSVAPPPALQPRRRPSRLLKKSFDWSAAGHPTPPSAFQETVSPRTPVARPPSPSHDEAARKSMGEFSEYVKTLPRSFATSYVTTLLEQEEKAPTPSSSSTAPQKDKERRGSAAIAREVSRKISAVFVGKR